MDSYFLGEKKAVMTELGFILKFLLAPESRMGFSVVISKVEIFIYLKIKITYLHTFHTQMRLG